MRARVRPGIAPRPLPDSKLVKPQGFSYIRRVQAAVDTVEAARAGRRRG